MKSQKIKRKSKHTTVENYQFTEEGSKIGRKKKNKGNMKYQKIVIQRALVSPYLQVITLYINALDSPMKRQSD